MPVTEQNCYHCGLAVSAGCGERVRIGGVERPMCCPGCAAVARAIARAGLDAFYLHRESTAQPPRSSDPGTLAVYDRPEVLAAVARDLPDGSREVALQLEGIVCAACVWLNERHVGALPGVLEFRVNLSSHRATLRWDPGCTGLAAILAAIQAIGYRAHPYDERRSAAARRAERSRALRHLAVAWLGTMQIMMIAAALWLGAGQGMTETMTGFLRWIALVIATPVALYAGQSFHIGAWRDLKRGRAGMDVPVSLAVLSTWGAGVWAVYSGHGEIYLESITMFVAFLLTGRFLEMTARQHAGETSEALARLQPDLATRIEDGTEIVVAAAALRVGDMVRVRPGERIPADGEVLEGSGTVDESLVTGESLPRAKTVGSSLMCGTVNVDASLLMRVSGVGGATALSAIQRLLDRAQSEKPVWVRRAERGIGAFTLLVLLLAGVSGAAWLWLDPSRAFMVVVAVLVASCPCALALATPAALTVATGALAGRGVLATRGHALERLAEVDTVVLDKTGTLTEGCPVLDEVRTAGGDDTGQCLALAAALAAHSAHPLARAIKAAAGDSTLPAGAVSSVPGGGIEGEVNGRRLRLGRPAFALAAAEDAAGDEDASLCVLAEGGRALAQFRFHDRVRPQAAELVRTLRDRGLHVVLMSGDAAGAVARVARVLGIDDAHAGMLPADKLAALQALGRDGRRVLMVGDGVNDAPVLAAAPVSASLAAGAELARASADLLLYDNRLDRLPDAFVMADAARRVIRQNVAWALGYNALALPVAAAGLLAPWLAALGMSLSSLLVAVNALRLRLPPEREAREPVGREVLS